MNMFLYGSYFCRAIPSQMNMPQLEGDGKADSRFAPSQWEMSLQNNAVSHWLGVNLDSV